MCISCFILKATKIHSEYVIFIAFARQLWLHDSISLLRYMYVACLVIFVYILTVNNYLLNIKKLEFDKIDKNKTTLPNNRICHSMYT